MEKVNKDLLKNITILYVEDEITIAEQVKFFFSRFVKGFYVASNGLEGLELYKEINPDIIITDIQMPKMNGLDMIKEIDDKNIPVIITTAYSDSSYLLKAIELNVDKFVIKPVNLVDLVSDVQRLVLKTHLQDKLLEKEILLDIIDENVLMLILDQDKKIIDASNAFCKLTGYSKLELIGQTHEILYTDEIPKDFDEKIWDSTSNGKSFSSEIINKTKMGEEIWNNLTITPIFQNDEIVKYIEIRQDITNKKKLEILTIEDDLTKIYNRRYFNKVIDRELRRVKRENSTISLLSLDIDYFKKYNDAFGHPKGDELLVKIATTLKSLLLRASDYLFRMGGEEFSIIFSGLDIKESMEFSRNIIKKIEDLNEYHADGTKVTISAGLIVQTASYLKDEVELYKKSDDALYEAKQNGRNQFVLSKESK